METAISMRRFVLLLPLALTLLAGCGIVGRWETVRVEPEQDAFSLGFVTFAEGGRYTASARIGGVMRTSTGTYERTAGSLVLTPTTGPSRTYRCRRSVSGAELTLEHLDGEVLNVATLHKID
jgi:hypothetical protein